MDGASGYKKWSLHKNWNPSSRIASASLAPSREKATEKAAARSNLYSDSGSLAINFPRSSLWAVETFLDRPWASSQAASCQNGGPFWMHAKHQALGPIAASITCVFKCNVEERAVQSTNQQFPRLSSQEGPNRKEKVLKPKYFGRYLRKAMLGSSHQIMPLVFKNISWGKLASELGEKQERWVLFSASNYFKSPRAN